MEILNLSLSRAKLIRSLHRGKGRARERAYLAEGKRLLEELSQSPARVRFLFGTEEESGWLARHFPGASISVAEEPGALFATEQAQGVGAIVDMPDAVMLDDLAGRGGPILFLDGLADPGNVGTILRTAEWFGLGGVLFGRGSIDPFNPKVVRSSMGAIFRLPVVEEITPHDIITLGLPLFALDAHGARVLGRELLPRRGVYIIGGEAHGVSPDLLERAEPIAIMGSGRGESLNAAIATAILLYELHRGSHLPPPTA
ncbi:MAG: rRNA methylase [Chlorobi bacterium]|nr:rRNA methylase [Chlorobiota bacterium]